MSIPVNKIPKIVCLHLLCSDSLRYFVLEVNIVTIAEYLAAISGP